MIIYEKIDAAREILGYMGKMLSASKTDYSKKHSKSTVFFNGNVYDSDGQKIWYGDIDLTRENKKIERLAKVLGESIYVTAEQPFRWSAQTRETLEEAITDEYVKARRFDP